MFHALSLRGKILGVFIAMVIMVLVGEGGMLWYTYRMDTMLGTVVEKEFVLYRTGQDMELALANQKGLLTYYLVDGDGKWLQSLGQQREIFFSLLEQCNAFSQEQWRAIEETQKAGSILAKKLRMAQLGSNVICVILSTFSLFILYKYIPDSFP